MENRALNDAADRFNASQTKYKVEVKNQDYAGFADTVYNAVANGIGPSIIFNYGTTAVDYANEGLAIDIRKYIKKDAKKGDKTMQNIIDSLPEAMKTDVLGFEDGGIYYLPGCTTGPVLFYNKTIFKDLGLEVPKTIDELEAVCEKLKANNIIPFSLANASKWTGSMYYMYLVARHSGNAEFDAAYTQENGGTFTSDAFVYAGSKIQDWVKKGYFPDGVNSLSADDNQDRALLYDGSAAMMLHGAWQVSGIKADSEEWYNENVGVFRFPEDSEAKANGVPQDVEIGTAIGM